MGKDGTAVWTRLWDNGRQRSESTWRDAFADGLAGAAEVAAVHEGALFAKESVGCSSFSRRLSVRRGWSCCKL